MDPITIVTTAGFAIQTLFQITSTLYNFFQGTTEVDEKIADFVREIDSLKGSILSIESCLKNPTLRTAQNAKGEAQDVFVSLNKALHNCQTTLNKLSTTLNKAKGQHTPGRNVFRRATTHINFSLSLPDLSTYRAQILSHTSAMEIGLQTITLFTSIRGPELILSNITPKLDLLVSLVAENNAGDPESTKLLKKTAVKVISSANTVISSQTTVLGGGSVVGEEMDRGKQQRIIQWNNTTVQDARRPNIRHGESHGIDFVPEEEEEELQLFSLLVRKGQQHERQNELSEAEEIYRSALQAAGKTSLRNKSTLEHNDANLQLASILIRQGKSNEAKEFLSQLLSKAVLDLPDVDAGMEQQNRACHMLAKVYLELGELEDAERYCRKAMIARKKTHGTSSSEFHESAELRGQIWDKKGERNRAYGFRAMVTPLVERQPVAEPKPKSKPPSFLKDPISVDTDSIYSLSIRSEKQELLSSSTKSSETHEICISPTNMSVAPSHKHRPSDGSITSVPAITSPTRKWTMETVVAQPKHFHSNVYIPPSAEPYIIAEKLLERVLKLMKKTPYNYKPHTFIETRYFDPHAALRKAIYAGHLEVVWVLLYRFSDVRDFWESRRKSWKKTPFTKDRTQSFPHCIDEKFTYTVENKDRIKITLTLLDDACMMMTDMQTRRSMVDMLLEYGVDPNPPCTKPLTYTIKQGPYDLIPILLHYGTEVDGHEMGEETPLAMILADGRSEGQDIACLFLSHNASINIFVPLGSYSVSPLHKAASLNWTKFMHALLTLSQPIDPNLSSPLGTALCIAASSHCLESVELLLSKGANIEAVQLPSNASPLCLAAETGDVAIVQSLLDHGADVNHGLKDGTTALELATERRHKDIRRLLKESGAKI